MPGKTGRRAKPAGPCGRCGKPIEGTFCRKPKADYHQGCFMEEVAGERMTTALDLAEELIVLRDLAYGVSVLASPKYMKMTSGQIDTRRQELYGILKKIKISEEPPEKVRMTASDCFGESNECQCSRCR